MTVSIDDLTKDELLRLIKTRFLAFHVRDIQRIRWDSLTSKAKSLMDEACIEIKKYKGIENYEKWKEANKKFDRAMKLYDDAEKFCGAMK